MRDLKGICLLACLALGLAILANCSSRTLEPTTPQLLTSPLLSPLPSTPTRHLTERPEPVTPPVKVPLGMVYIPAGEFRMGSTEDEIEASFQECVSLFGECERQWFESQSPAHNVNVAAFFIDITEVTNAQYRQCVETGACSAPQDDHFYSKTDYDDHPVVYVRWSSADAYCAWAGKRLPTEVEWQKAAQGIDRREYPWGNEWTTGSANLWDGGAQALVAVNRYPDDVSPYGAIGMGGNAAEWIADWYDAYPGSASVLADYGQKFRVIRGGSWRSRFISAKCGFRDRYGPEGWGDNLGFRCVQDVP
jgi:formylglycine-generating enzyme required for sulfatase activity